MVNGFGIVGSTGPALAAILVSALREPERSRAPASQRWRFFGLVALLTLAVLAARRLWITPEWLTVAGQVTTTAAYPSYAALAVDVLAAGVVAFVLSGVYSPIRGVRHLLHTSINVTPIFLPTSTLGAGLWLLLTVGAALWLWRMHRRSGSGQAAASTSAAAEVQP